MASMTKDNDVTYLSVMVVGDNPDELMGKYDKNLVVPEHILIPKDSKNVKENFMKILTKIDKFGEKYEMSRKFIEASNRFKDKIDVMTNEEFINAMCAGYEMDKDGNVISTENPDGRWESYRLGQEFAMPLKLKTGGDKVFYATNSEVDWDGMENEQVDNCRRVWDVVFNGVEPENETEKLFAEHDFYRDYLESFGSIETFIKRSCSFFTYSYLDENGWVDIDDYGDSGEWIEKFRERFIDKLKDDDKITIFEYKRF